MRPFMRLRHVRAPILVGAIASVALSLAGCGASEPSYYTLNAVPGVAQGGGPITLKVRTPSVATMLDRDYIVRNDQDNKLKLAPDAAWGEPLADMIGRGLVADLQQRLPGTSVFAEAGSISTEAQAVVELDVSQFAEDSQGHAEINALLSVQRPDSGPAQSHVIHLVASPQGSDVAALAATLSQLLGQVADEAAREARALGPIAPDTQTMPAQPRA